MHPQQLEEMEFEMGRFTNDFAAAYAHSMLEFEPRTHELQEALNAGKFCVVANVPHYCHHTDAILGGKEELSAAFDTRAEAEHHLEAHEFGDEDVSIYILPRPPRAAINYVPAADDEVPF